MNDILFIEPYNPWRKKSKTPQEIRLENNERDEMIARILAEASRTQTIAQTAQATVAGTPAAAAGGGGVPPFQLDSNSPVKTGAFTYTPTTGLAPLTVTFHATDSPFCSFTWSFGDGVTATGRDTTHVYDTGSFSASLRSTNNLDGTSVVGYTGQFITGSFPTLAAGFYALNRTGSAPLTVTFVNTTVNGANYEWSFGAGSRSGSALEATATSASTFTFTYPTTGSFTVRLRVTGSYGAAALTASAGGYTSASV